MGFPLIPSQNFRSPGRGPRDAMTAEPEIRLPRMPQQLAPAPDDTRMMRLEVTQLRAYDRNPQLENLLLDIYFKELVVSSQDAWRQVVCSAARIGIPIPAISAALNYYDGYRSERLPHNLLQAQRDYFGSHTYERIDAEGFFHTDWQQLKR